MYCWCLTHLGLGGGVEDSVLMVPHPPGVGGEGEEDSVDGAPPTQGWGRNGRGQCVDGCICHLRY